MQAISLMYTFILLHCYFSDGHRHRVRRDTDRGKQMGPHHDPKDGDIQEQLANHFLRDEISITMPQYQKILPISDEQEKAA
mmetsp:Transcript_38417/g.43862  ORF Transcript_38417/g.43862 Transcript_38417/m.43862 type:complete len:81 (+) Transcript_38417:409-651(+)